jgi:protein involved in ribonucleotide reduction
MGLIVYFSSTSENTHRFVEKLNIPAQRIPLLPSEPPLCVDEPYVLIVPTYGGGDVKGAVPKQVVRFLNDEHNRSLLEGVIASGNTNFGWAYAIAGDIISSKCAVPFFYKFELMGTAEDVTKVRGGLAAFWAERKAA